MTNLDNAFTDIHEKKFERNLRKYERETVRKLDNLRDGIKE